MNPLRILLFALLTAGAILAQSPSETAAPPAASGARAAASDERNLLVNENFENGTDGWEFIAFQKEGTQAEASPSPVAASGSAAPKAEADKSPSEIFAKAAPIPSKNHAESPEITGVLQPKMLRVAGTIDGSGRIVFTRYSVIYEHKHWSRPTNMTFDGEPWDLLRTPESWGKLGEQLDLTKAWIVKRSGRDVIALEHTADGFDLYLCDSPNGAAFYEVIIAIPRR